MWKDGRNITGPAWVFIFFACIISRLLTAIRYIEDPDSLRFALSAVNYDVAALQPHFPAYPVFCFMVKSIYFFTGNFSIAFAIIGGLATFATIFFTVRTALSLWETTPQWLLALLLFFNPLIWIMGNRFMPDLCGLALVMAGFSLSQHRNLQVPLLALTTALLAGTRLSYIPLLLLPVVWILVTETNKNKLLFILALVFATLSWLVPLILDTGLQPLIETAQKQTTGHFEDFGGTITTESDFSARLITFFRHGWADGLGGFWPGRHWITIIFSLCLLPFLTFGISRAITAKEKRMLWLLAGSFVLYAGWILLYQNIIFKSRHHLPLIPVCLVVASLGYALIRENWPKLTLGLIIILLGANVAATVKLIDQHVAPTAVAQLKIYLEENDFEDQILVTSDLVKYYLNKQKIKANYIDINNENSEIETWINEGKKVYIVANLDLYHNLPLKRTKTFYHNPYVNRMWPVVILSEVQLKTE